MSYNAQITDYPWQAFVAEQHMLEAERRMREQYGDRLEQTDHGEFIIHPEGEKWPPTASGT